MINSDAVVSVVIPTYNRANTITDSIRSVLNQTYRTLEVIIVDDGSTDNTEEIVKSIPDLRVVYVKQENAGACAARNTGISRARGEYIAFHDSDDTWMPEKLEREMDAMLTKNTDIVVCKLLMKFPDGSEVYYPKRIADDFLTKKDDLFGIGTQTILAKREVVENIKFDTGFPRYQDLDWLLQAMEKYKIYCVGDHLVNYAVGDDSISAKPEKMVSALQKIHQKYPNITKDYPTLSLHIVKNLVHDKKICLASSKISTKEYNRLIKAYIPPIYEIVNVNTVKHIMKKDGK